MARRGKAEEESQTAEVDKGSRGLNPVGLVVRLVLGIVKLALGVVRRLLAGLLDVVAGLVSGLGTTVNGASNAIRAVIKGIADVIRPGGKAVPAVEDGEDTTAKAA